MKVAQKRDAVLQGMFYFRKDICKAGGSAVVDGCGQARNSSELAAEEYTLMSIDTIINGKVGAVRPHLPTAIHRGGGGSPRGPFLAGRGVSWANPSSQLLPREHGGGCGHQM